MGSSGCFSAAWIHLTWLAQVRFAERDRPREDRLELLPRRRALGSTHRAPGADEELKAKLAELMSQHGKQGSEARSRAGVKAKAKSGKRLGSTIYVGCR